MNRQAGKLISQCPLTGILAAIAAILLLSQVSSAHSPSDMQVSYDPVSQQLTVAITHQVPDPASHYVREVVVTVNDRDTATRQYTSQPSPSSFTYTYDMNAPPGSTIAAAAHCSQGGSIQRSVLVASDLSQSPVPGTTLPAPTKSPLSVLTLFAPLVVVLAICRRKYQ